MGNSTYIVCNKQQKAFTALSFEQDDGQLVYG